ncbi:MAG: hypothetical protein JO352_39360 [Chloroflexi bacterium]|nr:hypothetical protein [Chloroflexota bacterium]
MELEEIAGRYAAGGRTASLDGVQSNAWLRVRARALAGPTVIVLLYVTLYGALLVRSNFYPYVFDNNESFSDLFHARNLATFGLAQSWGLADEAVNQAAAAHPYVYTHEGNFPRLFILLLYWLGARTVQAQIVLSTFTVGLLAIGLGYLAFNKMANGVFAFIATTVFITDYLLVGQWLVNTFRVWHYAFLFGCLVLALSAGTHRKQLWSVCALLMFWALFYFEFTFAVFTLAVYLAYCGWRSRESRRQLLVACGVPVAGALAGCATLVVQLIGYMGWAGLLTDLSLTYTTRNLAGDARSLSDQLVQFYASRHIVFWPNIVDGAALRPPDVLVGSLFVWVFQTVTPLLTLLVALLSGGWLIGRLPWERLGWSSERLRGRGAAPIAIGAVFVGWTAVWVALLGSLAFLGASSVDPDWSVGALGISVLGALACTLLYGVVLTRSTSGWSTIGVVRAIAACALLIAISQLIVRQPALYRQDWQALWLGQLEAWIPTPVARGMLLAACFFCVSMATSRGNQFTDAAGLQLTGVATYLASGAVAYVVTYLALPGYVTDGYLQRSAPLFVFVSDVLIAMAVYLPVAVILRIVRRERAASATTPPGALISKWSFGIVAGIVFCSLTVTWLNVQRRYVDLLPPDHFAFLSTFQDAPFAGSTFAVNTYAVPVAGFSGGWAYMDERMSSGDTSMTDHGVEVDRDAGTYLWFADRDTNSAYQTPAYYVCMVNQDFQRLVGQLEGGGAPRTCMDAVVARAAARSQNYIQDKVVAQDAGQHPTWAILKLDWDYAPYLKPLTTDPQSTAHEHVRLSSVQQPDGSQLIQVDYQYAQQDGAPETDTQTRVLLVSARDGQCAVEERDGPGPWTFTAPPGFSGQIRASVEPHSATKAGDQYDATPIGVGEEIRGSGTGCN